MTLTPQKYPEEGLPPKHEKPVEKYEIELVEDPESLSLIEFRDFLLTHFQPGEVEPLTVLQNELRRNFNQLSLKLYRVLHNHFSRSDPFVVE